MIIPSPGLLTPSEQATFREWLTMLGRAEFQDSDPDGAVVRTVVAFAFRVLDEQAMRLIRMSTDAQLSREERDACNVTQPGQRRALYRGTLQIAPRARWGEREYDYLGLAEELGAYDDDTWLHVLCDDDGHVIAVHPELHSGGLVCQCQKCGRWDEDVQAGYGPGDTIVWECPEYCGWQDDMDSGRWGE